MLRLCTAIAVFVWVSAAAPALAGPATPTATVIATGDVTLGYNFQKYVDEPVRQALPPAERFGFATAGVCDALKAADVTVVNLEGPLTRAATPTPKNFAFKGEPENVAVIAGCGVDAVTLANNHNFDYGADGLAETRSTVEKAGIGVFGAGQTLAAARKAWVRDVRGVRIGFLGYLYLGPTPPEPAVIWAGKNSAGAAGHATNTAAVREMVVADVKKLARTSDIQIVVMHWGRETFHEPHDYQAEIGHAAIDAGADAVIGHHPHVLQGIERYQGKPIVYSLGNFIFGGNWNPKNKESLIVRLTLTRDGATTKLEALPVLIDGLPQGKPFAPRPAPDDDAARIREHMTAYGKPFAEPWPIEFVDTAAFVKGP